MYNWSSTAPGDVDIWLDASQTSVLSYVRQHVRESEMFYYYVDFLLGEVLMAGNFGQYNEHLQEKLQSSVLSFKAHRALRVFRFLRSYLSEVL